MNILTTECWDVTAFSSTATYQPLRQISCLSIYQTQSCTM